MKNVKEQIDAVIDDLNRIIVGADTPTRLVNQARKFRKSLMSYAASVDAAQAQINFDTSTKGATDADGNVINDVYTV